jgi:hypothetical protein
MDLLNVAAKGDITAMSTMGLQAKAAHHLNALAEFRALWPEAVAVARENDAAAADAAVAAARAAEAAQVAS